MTNKLSPPSPFLPSCCLAFCLTAQAANAEFSLNFQPIEPDAVMRTHIIHGGDVYEGHTPYLAQGILQLPEIVTDPETGNVYYHMIVGDLADGFIQETFIQTAGRYQGGPGSAVGGDGDSSGGNGRDPLDRDPGIYTANAKANPKKVLIRQIVTDGEITMEYLKDRYDRKALITQTLSAPDINADFAMDMRSSTYDDMTTAGEITNTMNIPSLAPDGLGSFDMATDTQNSEVTGGRYTYTDGTEVAGSGGTYDYYEGGYDHANQEWDLYFDNTIDNPWSYLDNRPE